MKKIATVRTAPSPHWVGDGFPARSLFSYRDDPRLYTPFLLLDYAGPARFSPVERPRGVGQHPHRGFETVTIVYEGDLEHRDSTGAGGRIGKGDVQWMTAASGVIHEEFHSRDFARTGGVLEMVQLWVNLPAKDKMSPPRYQTLLDARIPQVALPENAGHVRVIAGEFGGAKAPARTSTPMNVWDVRLAANGTFRIDARDGNTLLVVVLHGTVLVNDERVVREAELVVFEREGDHATIEANTDSIVLVLSGEPIDEPVVGYGPFVMNNEAQIRQAMLDFQRGTFGTLAPATD